MLRIFMNLFGGAPAGASPEAWDSAEGEQVAVRFRPRLIAQLLEDHAALRNDMRRVLDACRRRDEDAQIVGLQRFAETFRRSSLIKSVQFHPYLYWALARERVATSQIETLIAQAQDHVQAIDALLRAYLNAPWLTAQRRALFGDIARIAHLLAQVSRMEESSLFPLYVPPGQYRHLRGARAI
ncbi:MAG: hypothetical protein ABIO49_12320 [Dokdonella sp.]